MSVSRKRDLAGETVGHWRVLAEYGRNAYGAVLWLCVCACGTRRTVVSSSLVNGKSTNCGCVQKQKNTVRSTKHGLHHTPERAVWSAMKQRCSNPKVPSYPYYGGRGIKVSPEWQDSFAAFIRDMGRRPSAAHTLERLDNSKGYCKENCAWVSRTDNNRNKRTYRTNNTGVSGITRTKEGKFNVSIGKSGKRSYIGRYDTLDEAVAARKAAEEARWGRTTNP